MDLSTIGEIKAIVRITIATSILLICGILFNSLVIALSIGYIYQDVDLLALGVLGSVFSIIIVLFALLVGNAFVSNYFLKKSNLNPRWIPIVVSDGALFLIYFLCFAPIFFN